MNTQEIQEQLLDGQEATVRINERVTALENKEVILPEVKDHTPQLEQILQVLNQLSNKHEDQQLTDIIKQQHGVAENLLQTVKNQNQNMVTLVREFPEKLKVKIAHHFEEKDRVKVWVIIGAVGAIAIAVCIGLTVIFGIRNSELSAEADRFKVIRAFWPNVALSIDSAYIANEKKLMSDANIHIQQQKSLSDAQYKEQEAKREYERAFKKRKAIKAKGKK